MDFDTTKTAEAMRMIAEITADTPAEAVQRMRGSIQVMIEHGADPGMMISEGQDVRYEGIYKAVVEKRDEMTAVGAENAGAMDQMKEFVNAHYNAKIAHMMQEHLQSKALPFTPMSQEKAEADISKYVGDDTHDKTGEPFKQPPKRMGPKPRGGYTKEVEGEGRGGGSNQEQTQKRKENGGDDLPGFK
jgi:hypothetical protein